MALTPDGEGIMAGNQSEGLTARSTNVPGTRMLGDGLDTGVKIQRMSPIPRENSN